MKKLLLILLIFAAFTVKSQIILVPDTVRVNVGSEWKYIKHINYLTQATPVPILQDSAIYTYFSFPVELERLEKNGFYWIGDTCYEWTNKTKVVQTYAGRLIMYQYIRKSVMQTREKSEDMKLWFYMKKAKEHEYTDLQYFNYPAVNEILNPPPTTSDSIQ